MQIIRLRWKCTSQCIDGITVGLTVSIHIHAGILDMEVS